MAIEVSAMAELFLLIMCRRSAISLIRNLDVQWATIIKVMDTANTRDLISSTIFTVCWIEF